MRPLMTLALIACARSRPEPVLEASAPVPVARDEAEAGAPEASALDASFGGLRAEDWEIARGAWSFDGGEAACACDAISSVMYYRGSQPKDFEASVEVRFDQLESSAGLVFREVGDDFMKSASFYQYEWYTRGTHHDRRLSLMIKNPYWVQIVEPITREPPLREWIRLRVRAVGERLETFLGSERVFDERDATFTRAGRVGIHVYQPRPVRLRSFHLEAIP